MSINLYDHQRLAVDRMRNGCILCGGTGSGKSITSLAYFYEKICEGSINSIESGCTTPRNLYIITPASKRDNFEWEKECAPFLLSKDPENSNSGIKVTIDSWNNIHKYCNTIGAFFIFDEQKVSGSGAWVKAFYQIAKKNKWILLSATPGDKWEDYIPVFVANGFYKNRSEFIREHIIYNPYVKFPKVDHYIGVRKLISLKESILINMEFIRESEMHYEDIEVDYDKKIYEYILYKRWNIYENRPIKNASELGYLLRKAVNSSPSRIEATKKIIYENPRLIIFYNYDYELEILRDICKESNVIFAERNGHKHMPIPKSGKWVYLVNYASGAEAWNCIETNTVLLYSLNYSYRTIIQAAGRIDRLNTPYKDLYCKKLISMKSPIDHQISKCLKNKKDFNDGQYFKNLYDAIDPSKYCSQKKHSL